MPVLEKSFSRDLYKVRIQVDEEYDNARLDAFVGTHLATFSREEIKRRIKMGEIFIEGRKDKHKSSTKIKHRDVLVITIPRTIQEDEYWRGELIEFDEPKVLFEDDDVIMMEKPPYMSTHPTGRHIFYCATVHFEEIYKRTIHSIHRLDRETSGVLMLAKNPKIAAVMTDQFEKGLVSKCYFFMAKKRDWDGSKEFTAEQRLSNEGKGLDRVYIDHHPKDSKRGKHAETSFQILDEFGEYVLGLAFPKTGRQHQIRVHAMAYGLPLVGDKLYLGSFPMFQRFKDNIAKPEDFDLMELSRHALHAIALRFPYKGETKTIRAGLPKDFTDWLLEKGLSDIKSLEEKIENTIQSYWNKD